MADVAGWLQLMNGHIASALFISLNTGLGGYLMLILFVAVSAVLYIKTQAIEIPFIVGLFFFAIFGIGQYIVDGTIVTWLNSMSFNLILTILIFELGGVLYKVFWKPN